MGSARELSHSGDVSVALIHPAHSVGAFPVHQLPSACICSKRAWSVRRPSVARRPRAISSVVKVMLGLRRIPVLFCVAAFA